MLRDLARFTIAVARHWGILVTGGFIVGLIALVERVSGKAISGWPLWLALGMSLFLASFLAWRDERQVISTLNKTLEDLNETIKKLQQDTISLTPEDLIKPYDGRTTIQGQKLASTYVGKWITVSGSVDDVESNYGTLRIRLERRNPMVDLTFDEQSKDSVSVLRKGDTITARCEIQSIGRGFISLKNCELIRF